MIQKITWRELINKHSITLLIFTGPHGITELVDEVDLLFTKTYKEVAEGQSGDGRISAVYNEMCKLLSTTSSNFWGGMPIYISSWSYQSALPINEIVLRLTQYLGFYKKILTDKGFARKVLTHREYSNDGESDGTNKQLNSEVPQKVISSFEDAISYISTANKNEDHTESNNSGESDLSVESTSWDEAEKNMKYIFYNELCTYIRSIPKIIYSEYSLDSMPSPDIVEETFKYFKDMYERR